MKTLLKNKTLSSIWTFRLVRWAFGAFFFAIGLLYKDAWAAYIFGGLFFLTSLFKPVGCAGGNCSIEKTEEQLKKKCSLRATV